MSTPYPRPRFHFTPEAGWINDPNGLVRHDGIWHLFYQHNPHDVVWGDIHWGHAVSADLVEWRHLPAAIAPDAAHPIVASGSAVHDAANTSGFGNDTAGPLVAIFSHFAADESQIQSIAASVDGGLTWTQYAGNPVIPNPGIRDFRDPKVFWHAPTRRWVMSLAAGDHLRLYTSPNLKSWTLRQRLSDRIRPAVGALECPDLVEVPHVGGGTQWVLLYSVDRGGVAGDSGSSYVICDFDGARIVPRSDPRWVDCGPDHYAVQCWSTDTADAAVTSVGWMSNWQYARATPAERGARGMMNVPRLLTVADGVDGPVLRQAPVDAIGRLRGRGQPLHPGASIEGAADIECAFEGPCSLVFENAFGESVQIAIDGATGALTLDRSGALARAPTLTDRFEAPFERRAGPVVLRALLDTESVEVFVDDGLLAVSALLFPSAPFSRVRWFGRGEGAIYPL